MTAEKQIVYSIDKDEYSLLVEIVRQADLLMIHPKRPKCFLAKAVRRYKDYKEAYTSAGGAGSLDASYRTPKASATALTILSSRSLSVDLEIECKQ